MSLLTKELAQDIVNRTMAILHKNINVMDDNGRIIGSGDLSRINEYHEGAVQVLEKNKSIEIDENEAKVLNNAKPGINLPILFYKKIVGVIGITGDPKDIRQYAELVKMAAEMALQQSFLMERFQWKQRLKEELVNQLIYDDLADESLIVEHSQSLGINLSIPRIAFIINIEDNKHREAEQEIIKQISNQLGENDLVSRTFDSDLIVLKSITKKGQDISSYINHVVKSIQFKGIKVGVGHFFEGIKGLKHSFETARKALFAGKKLYPESGIYYYDHLCFEVLMSDLESPNMDSAFQFFDHLLKQDKNDQLYQTLQVYIKENGELNETAKKLYIHRNTCTYRLEKIYKITGKDPRKTKDLLELYAASLVYQLRK
ncbi:CdaR family transcriptional regulator [Scopulibacillus cellulosilyticus]|uniref:CdaR family transcriptional regulator n=1 Tax=Scopulibacillus cellulosilyticus TaxID=2665665 RepID=A0ABW2Q612_9BACL